MASPSAFRYDQGAATSRLATRSRRAAALPLVAVLLVATAQRPAIDNVAWAVTGRCTSSLCSGATAAVARRKTLFALATLPRSTQNRAYADGRTPSNARSATVRSSHRNGQMKQHLRPLPQPPRSISAYAR